jgi:putative transposase
MSDLPGRHHRRSIRLQGYDYTRQGAYFTTICTHKRECVLGDIVEDQMVLSSAGRIVEECWLAIPEHFPQVDLDAFVVMPNHLHGILILAGREDNGTMRKAMEAAMGGTIYRAPTGRQEHFRQPVAGSIPTIVRTFKAAVSRKADLASGFGWQRNYYEHIIRSEGDLSRIREYIVNNPLRWETDENYSAVMGKIGALNTP